MSENMTGIPVSQPGIICIDLVIMKYYHGYMDDNFCDMCHRPHKSVVQPQLYDVAATCRLLSISRSTFYLLVKEGRISVSKLGTKTLVTSYAIRDFVQAVDGNDIANGSL